MAQYIIDIDPDELAMVVLYAPTAVHGYTDSKKSGTIGHLLPALSKSSYVIPSRLLDEPLPETFRDAVCVLYTQLADESLTGTVSTDSMLFAVLEFLRDTAHIAFEKDMEECNIRFSSDDDDMAREAYFDELMQNDALYAYAFELTHAVQEIEGLMSFNIRKGGVVSDIVAPVQCGIMDLFEGD